MGLGIGICGWQAGRGEEWLSGYPGTGLSLASACILFKRSQPQMPFGILMTMVTM